MSWDLIGKIAALLAIGAVAITFLVALACFIVAMRDEYKTGGRS